MGGQPRFQRNDRLFFESGHRHQAQLGRALLASYEAPNGQKRCGYAGLRFGQLKDDPLAELRECRLQGGKRVLDADLVIQRSTISAVDASTRLWFAPTTLLRRVGDSVVRANLAQIFIIAP
jgi:hypothetical protein